jgi:hypothetical protein
LVNCAHYVLGPFGEDSDLRRHGGEDRRKGRKERQETRGGGSSEEALGAAAPLMGHGRGLLRTAVQREPSRAPGSLRAPAAPKAEARATKVSRAPHACSRRLRDGVWPPLFAGGRTSNGSAAPGGSHRAPGQVWLAHTEYGWKRSAKGWLAQPSCPRPPRWPLTECAFSWKSH